MNEDQFGVGKNLGGDSIVQYARMRARIRVAIGFASASMSFVLLTACSGHGGSAVRSPQVTSPAPAGIAARPVTTTSLPRTGTTLASALPVPKRLVPAPSGGNVHQKVVSRSVHTLPAVAFSAQTHFGGGVSARIDHVRRVGTVTHVPGEIGGASVAVSVTLTNHSGHAIAVGDVVVNALNSTGAPGVIVSSAPTKVFTGSISAGKSAHAVYAFSMAMNHRRQMSVTVSYAATAPVARFVGDVQ